MEKILISQVKNLFELKEYGFDNRYVCDKKGQVYLTVTKDSYRYYGKPMKPFTTLDGYIEYVLTLRAGNKKHIQAQRLVALLFLPPPRPDQLYVDHKDGDRSNNNVKNLEWVTQSENIRRSWKYRKNPNRIKYTEKYKTNGK